MRRYSPSEIERAKLAALYFDYLWSMRHYYFARDSIGDSLLEIFITAVSAEVCIAAHRHRLLARPMGFSVGPPKPSLR
jgi:hypothetical protein